MKNRGIHRPRVTYGSRVDLADLAVPNLSVAPVGEQVELTASAKINSIRDLAPSVGYTLLPGPPGGTTALPTAIIGG
jgi:hypothetical protein